MNATDFLIQCGNPDAFDTTIQQLGAAALIEGSTKGSYLQKDGYYIMRVFGDTGYLKFAIQQQGYGQIIKQLPELV